VTLTNSDTWTAADSAALYGLDRWGDPYFSVSDRGHVMVQPRGDLAVNIGRNVIHGSDAPETAEFEIGLWFQPSELSDWTPADQVWRVEG